MEFWWNNLPRGSPFSYTSSTPPSLHVVHWSLQDIKKSSQFFLLVFFLANVRKREKSLIECHVIAKTSPFIQFFFLIFLLLLQIMQNINFCSHALSLQGPPPQGPIKFTIADTLERIKEEFNFLQAQYHS